LAPSRVPLPPALLHGRCPTAARRQDPLRFLAFGRALRGLSVLTPCLAAGRWNVRAGAAATGWSSFNSQLTQQTMNKNNQPTFAERIAALKAAAETVMLEAQRM